MEMSMIYVWAYNRTLWFLRFFVCRMYLIIVALQQSSDNNLSNFHPLNELIKNNLSGWFQL